MIAKNIIALTLLVAGVAADHGTWRFQEEEEEVVERLAGARPRPRVGARRLAVDRARRLSMRLEEEAVFDVDPRRRRRERDGQDGRGHVLSGSPFAHVPPYLLL